MVIKKQAYDDEFAELRVRLDKKIRSALDKGELKEARDAKEEMEILQGLYPDVCGRLLDTSILMGLWNYKCCCKESTRLLPKKVTQCL
jgi:hypothetical protein